MKTFNTLSMFRWIATCVCLFSVSCSAAAAQERSGLALVQDQVWSCISSKQESELVFYDSGEGKLRKPPTVDWRLSHGNRVLGRGRTDQAKIDGRDAYVVRLDLSEVEIKSVVEAELLLLTEGDAELTKKVFLFPADPFADQKRVLNEARIHLFDPVGDTKTVFESAKIPFVAIHRLESIDSVEDALIIVGERLKPGRHSGLADSLNTAAERGNNVIWLAAGGGEIEFKLKNQTRFVLENETVIRRFDPRFDVGSWASKSPVATRWEPSQADNKLSLKASTASSAWPWIELNCLTGNTKESTSTELADEVAKTKERQTLSCVDWGSLNAGMMAPSQNICFLK